MIRKAIFLLAFLVGSMHIHAQQPQALLQTDTTQIIMGEQIKLTVSLFYSNSGKAAQIKWPAIPDSLEDGNVIVVDKKSIDTLPMSNDDPNAMMQRREIILTAFDSALHTVGPFLFIVNGDTVFTNTIDFQSVTFEVDTTKSIKDIKGIIDVPFTFLDWITEYKYLLLVGSAILTAIWFLLSFLKRRRKKQAELIIEPIDSRTIDEIALDKLEEIRMEKKWLSLAPKTYYSDLTDILRTYIEKRFEVLAMEQTTSELLTSLRYTNCGAEERGSLLQILSTADLVKFARQKTDEQTDMLSLDMAIRFVNNTRALPVGDIEENAEKPV